jgi:hypothetical protein
MQYVFADLVAETSHTTGTGDLRLEGALPGSRTFASVLAADDRFYYVIDGGPADPVHWEVGIGTYLANGDIARTPMVSSSGAGAVDLAAGAKTVALTVAAEFFARIQDHDVFAAWQARPGNSEATVDDFIDAMLGVDGVAVAMPRLSGEGTSRKQGLAFVPPVGMIDSAGDDNAVTAGLFNTISRSESGPLGREAFYETAVGIGTNCGSDGRPIEGFTGSAFFRAKSFCHSSGYFATETTIGHVARDTDAQQQVFHASIPVNSADRVTNGYVAMAAPVFEFNAPGAGTGVRMNLAAAARTIQLGSGSYGAHPMLVFRTNDRNVAQQSNADGTANLPLPYINSDNNLECRGTPVYIVSTTGATPLGGGENASTLAINVTSPISGASAIRVASAATTGNFYALSFQGAATGRLTSLIYNAGSGPAVMELQSLNGPGSDGLIALSNVGGGGQSWTIGRDNSDGNKLKIEKSYLTVGDAANLFMEFDPAANVARFGMPAQLKSYTVAALPSAATSGAGAMVFVTNESGGAVPAFSDGASWRRITDRVAVS